MLTVVFAVMLQQAAPLPAATGQVVWETPASVAPAEAVAAIDLPAIPDSARADPWGYERAECSPLIRSSQESLETCQARVRVTLAAHLGDALPAGLIPAGAPDECRQEAAGDRYALQCGAPARASAPSGPDLADSNCTTRPGVTGRGAVAFSETCDRGGQVSREDGLKVTFGGSD